MALTDGKEAASRRRFQMLSHLIKEIVTDRFRRMAREEIFSKFAAAHIDPALLVEHGFHAERDALEISRLSLERVMTSDEMETELYRAADKIQKDLLKIFPVEVSDQFASENLIQSRVRWFRARIDFYARWLSVEGEPRDIRELARLAFQNERNFKVKLNKLLEADRKYAEDFVKTTATMFRLMMMRQVDYELDQSLQIWNEFTQETFKKAKALPEV